MGVVPPLAAVRGVGVPGAEPAVDGGRDMVRRRIPRMDYSRLVGGMEKSIRVRRNAKQRTIERRVTEQRPGGETQPALVGHRRNEWEGMFSDHEDSLRDSLALLCYLLQRLQDHTSSFMSSTVQKFHPRRNRLISF